MYSRTAVFVAATVVMLVTAASAAARTDGSQVTNRAQVAQAVRALQARPMAELGFSGVARSGAAAALPATTFVGFALCEDGPTPAIPLRAWPAFDSTHQFTITRSYLISSTNPGFTSPTITASQDYWAGSDLNHFYRIRASDGVILLGPVPYGRPSLAWVPDTRPEYDAVANSISFYDNGTTTAPEFALVPTYGPQSANTNTTCTFP